MPDEHRTAGDDGRGTAGRRAEPSSAGRRPPGGDGEGRETWLRRAALGLGAVLLLLVLLAGALKLLFPPERLSAMAIPRVERALGRQVSVGSVRLRLLPPLAVRLEDFAVDGPPGLLEEPVVHGRALDLELAFLPLLAGRVRPKRIEVREPVVRFVVAPDGTHSFTGLGRREGEASGSGRAGGAGAAAGLLGTDLQLRNGRLLLSDRRTGRGGRLSFDLSVSAARGEGRDRETLHSEGRLQLADGAIRLPDLGADTLALPALTLEYALEAFPADDSVTLRRLSGRVAEVPLEASGSVWTEGGATRLDLRLTSGRVDAARLLASLPDGQRPPVRAGGDLSVDLRVSGPVGFGRAPALEGRLDVHGLHLGYGPRDDVLTDVDATLRARGDSVRADEVRGRLLGGPLTAQMTVSGFARPRLRGRLQGEVDLERLAGLAEAVRGTDRRAAERKPTGAPALPRSGRLAYDVRLSGPAAAPRQMTFGGSLRLADVAYPAGTLAAAPARIPSATVRLTGSGLVLDPATVQMGESDLTLSFQAERLFPLARVRARGASPPRVGFRVRSKRLDLGEVTAQDTARTGYSQLLTARLAGKNLRGREPGEIAAEQYGLPDLPPADLQGEVRVDDFVQPPDRRIRDLAFDVELAAGRLRIRNLTGTTHGGRLTGSLAVDLSAAEPPYPTEYAFSLQGARSEEVVRRYTRLGPALTGTVDASVSGTTRLDGGLLPLREVTSGRGEVVSRDGGFRRLPAADALMNRLGLRAPGALQPYRTLGGPFRVENGEMVLQGWNLRTDRLDGRLGGTVSLAGPLDLDLDLRLPLATLQESRLVKALGGPGGPLGRLLETMAGQSDTIPVQVGMGGTMADPVVRLDEEALRSAVREALGRKGRGLLDLFP